MWVIHASWTDNPVLASFGPVSGLLPGELSGCNMAKIINPCEVLTSSPTPCMRKMRQTTLYIPWAQVQLVYEANASLHSTYYELIDLARGHQDTTPHEEE